MIDLWRFGGRSVGFASRLQWLVWNRLLRSHWRVWLLLLRWQHLGEMLRWHLWEMLRWWHLWGWELCKILLLHLYKGLLVLQNKILFLNHLIYLLLIIFSSHHISNLLIRVHITILTLPKQASRGLLTRRWPITRQVLYLLKQRAPLYGVIGMLRLIERIVWRVHAQVLVLLPTDSSWMSICRLIISRVIRFSLSPWVLKGHIFIFHLFEEPGI